MAYLGFHKGAKFLPVTSAYTKGGQTMFSYFFLWRRKIFAKRAWPNGPHKSATVNNFFKVGNCVAKITSTISEPPQVRYLKCLLVNLTGILAVY